MNIIYLLCYNNFFSTTCLTDFFCDRDVDTLGCELHYAPAAHA